jgi:hypothetical protein
MAYLTDDEFGELFTSFEHTAFRLEARESYAGVGYEVEPFTRWLAGEKVKWDTEDRWMSNVRAARLAGKRFARVRVVSEPWSEYTRYALWSCLDNLQAGEEIRYMPRTQASEIGIPAAEPGYDYWLFDSKLLVLLRYDDSNTPLPSEVVDLPAAIVEHNYWRDAAWHHAAPVAEFIQRAGERIEPPKTPESPDPL